MGGGRFLRHALAYHHGGCLFLRGFLLIVVVLMGHIGPRGGLVLLVAGYLGLLHLEVPANSELFWLVLARLVEVVVA